MTHAAPLYTEHFLKAISQHLVKSQDLGLWEAVEEAGKGADLPSVLSLPQLKCLKVVLLPRKGTLLLW